MMLNFLKRNYPVSRIKDGFRFKRAIIMDDGNVYNLSDNLQHKSLINNLINTLDVIFYCDYETSNKLIKEFLGIR